MAPVVTDEDLERIEAFIGVHHLASDGSVPEVQRLAFKRLLVAHDGSKRAAKALDWAIWFAKHFDSSIDVVAVVAPPPYLYDAGLGSGQEVVAARSYRHIADHEEAAAQRIVDEAAETVVSECGDGIAVATHVVHGAPAYAISNLAEEIDADLILLGSHGHNALERFLLGSITDSVNDKARRSILIARDSPPKDKASVLVANDGSSGGRRAVAAAVDIARGGNAALDVAHVVEPPHIQHPEHGAGYYKDLQELCAERDREADAM